MGEYEVLLRRSVLKKDLQRLPKSDVQRIMTTIHSLGENPRPSAAKKLSGQDRYRIRQGNYRIVFSIQDEEKTVHVVKVGHRRDVCR